MKMDISFTRQFDDEIQTTTAGFLTPMTITSDSSTLDIDEVKNNIITAIETFNVPGSNWIFDHVIKLSVRLAADRTIQGSYHVKTP